MSNMQDERQDELKGDEVVISGISGVFPKSDCVLEFMENLYNKVDMVVCVDPYFVHPDVPHHQGRMNEPNKLDAQFFKIIFNQAMSLDPVCRKLLEQSYSAIYDAGINPLTLDGKKVGIYVGIGYMDVLNFFMDCDNKTNVYYLSGSSKTMLANRISYYLNTKGPSYAIDASTASSLLSLEQAYQHLLSGEIESAIVAGCNICKQPTFSVNLRRAGLASLDGKTKCFDENGDGSVRSEAVSVVFLQKAKDAKRIYSQVYHVKTGYSKPDIHCFPNRDENDILTFLQEFYSEIDVAPSSVEYVEANAPGIASHDKIELKAISRFFGDKSPVKVGSVKSNMGNSEGASGMCSLTKVCLAYHTGTIAANINCSNPMKTEKAVILKENEPFNRGFIAINEFSYTGNDAHALLKGYYKPKDHNRYKCSLPYLVLVSGRDEDCVNHLFDILQSYPVDPEYVGMLHQIHNCEIKGHTSRGYIVLDGNVNQQSEALSRNVDYYAGNKRQIWFVFSGMGSQWVGMGEALMRIPIFNEAIQACDKVLKPKGLDIIKIICDKDKSIFDNILHCFVGIAAVQIGLMDILKAIGIECDYMIGHSAGETACGYADGCFTREEMILSAYSRGKASLESNCIPGTMAAVGMGYKDLYPICPPEIDIACHNSSESSTISGPADDIAEFLKELTAKEIFCKAVPSSNIAFHSRHISVVAPALRSYLNEVIKEPKLRSSKWLSTSVPEDRWEEPIAKFSSPEYHTNNLLNYVYFEEVLQRIPSDAVVIEIAPHGLLQAILKREHKDCLHIPLTRRGHEDQVKFLLEAIGKIYEAGYNVKIDALYPKIEYPVSTGTQFLSHLVKWEHTEDWLVLERSEQSVVSTRNRDVVISLSDEDYACIKDHVRDGMIILPESALLVLTWQTLAMSMDVNFKDLSVIFKDINFNTQVELKPEKIQNLSISITKNGRFEVVHKNQIIVTGYILEYENDPMRKVNHSSANTINDVTLFAADIYKFLNLRGHVYTNQFQSLYSLNLKCNEAYIKWAGDWITFLDSLIQIHIFANNHNGISRPKLIESLTIDIYEHERGQYKSEIDGAMYYKADYYENFNILRSGGVQVVNVNFENLIPQWVEPDFLGSLQFWPHFSETEVELNTAIAINMQIIADATLQKDIKITELRTSNINIISNAIKDVSTQLPIKLRFYDINIENGKLNLLKKHDLSQSEVLVVYDFVMDTEMIAAIYDQLPSNGFVLSLEKRKNKKYIIQTDYFNILTVFPINDDYTLVLINKVEIIQVVEDKVVLRVTDDSFSFMNTLRKELNNKKRIVLLYEKQHYCDLKGYLRSLRKEYRNKISLYMILDEGAPDFNVNNNFYTKQLQKNLPFNTLYDGEWGGYYYTTFNNYKGVPKNSKLCLTELGNINSWHWEEIENLNKSNTVEVQYAGLSLKDVEKVLSRPVNNKKISFGMDYSGFDARGNRVMGIIADGAISKEIEYDLDLLWPVPKTWSLEEAATVPLPYALAYYSLALRGTLYAGTTVFVNGGAGALGQAVISICLSLNCDIFTTVSDPGKKALLLKLYPTLKENQILNSRYDDFYASVIKQTNNKLCNYIINCESGTFRNSALKCLSSLGLCELGTRLCKTCSFLGLFERFSRVPSSHSPSLGTYLDLSTKDMIENKPLGISFAAGFKYYYSVNFSNIFKPEYSHEKKLLQSMIADGIAAGVVRPLTYTMFSSFEVSMAFKFLSSRTHRGRVLVDLRNPLNSNVLPRLVMNAQYTYIVVGDQDELCVSLMDLLIKRGAKKIFLQMRSKAVSPFIEAKMLLWRTQGIEVKVSRYEIEDEEKCKLFISDAAKLGPIEGLFIVLYKLAGPAYTNVPTTISNLDKLSRNMDYLRYFVILSSNVNSSEDELVFSMCSKICHYRKNIGLNAVLHRAEFVDEFESFGKNQKTYQSIHQVLNGMENSIKQNCSNVISYNTNKKAKVEYSRKLHDILGKQTNGTELNVNASLHDIAIVKLTIKEIRRLILEHYQVAVSERKLLQMSLLSIQNVEYYLDDLKNNIGLDAIISYVNDDSYEACDSFKQMLTLTNNIPEKLSDMEYVDPAADYLILIPGFQGDCSVFESLCSTLKIKGITVQLGPDLAANTISEMAESVLKNAVIRLEEKNKFYLLGYSFGVNIALEVAALLEKKGIIGTVFCLDSSPDALRVQLNTYTSDLADEELQNVLIDHIYYLITKETNNKLKEEIKTFNTFEEKVKAFVKATKERVPYPQEYIRLSVESVYNRILLAMKYNPTFTLESEIVLLKAINDSNADILPYDYNLTKYTKKPVKVVNIESNHTTLPFNVNVPNIINKMLDKDLLTKYKNTNLCKTYLIKKK